MQILGQRSNRRATAIALTLSLGITSISVLLPRPLTAEPLDVSTEIPGPADPEAKSRVDSDWIRTPAAETAKLDPAEYANLERQRKLVEEIARHELGETLHRTTDDLRIIQRMIDEKLLGKDPKDTVQALGVVLGDVIVAQHGYHWGAFVDQKGRSRCLRRFGSEYILFPVTAISRLTERNVPVDVREIYEQMTTLE